jgi:glycosyltransferase involved in cell wall biosynthesis
MAYLGERVRGMPERFTLCHSEQERPANSSNALTMLQRKLNIFISNPSRRLTDYQPYGDGLVAWEFVSRLAGRGHVIHVAASDVQLATKPLPNLIIHEYALRFPTFQPFEAMYRIRGVFRGLRKTVNFDVIHQLNPVIRAMSGLLLHEGVPLVLGPFVLPWPADPSRRNDQFTSRRILTRELRRLAGRINAAEQRAASALILSSPKVTSVRHLSGSANARTRVIPLGVDTRRFVPCFDESRAPTPNPSILFLANLNVRKGVYTLLDAFERVSEAVPACCLVIAGDGVEREGVRTRIESMKSRRMISMVGAIERERVADVLRNCTLYCLPSHGDPFPATALEAMACGKPLVVTDGGGLGEFVDDPRGGRKVPIRDAQALADALIEMLKCSSETLDSMGRHNRATAVQRYEWESVIDQLERVYEEVIAPDGRTLRASSDL